MATVIDALIVTLGLDTTAFRKGQAEAEKAAKNTADSGKKSADQMSKAFAEVGRSVALMFLEFESASGFIKWLGGLNASEAQLGRTSEVLGVSAHQLNQWGLAAELNGGKAEDIAQSVDQLSQSLFDLNVKGTTNGLTEVMMRLGVSTNATADKFQTLLELGDKLRDYKAQFGEAAAYNLARMAGLNQSTFLLITKEKGERDAILSQAERNNAVNEESIRQAQELQKAWRDVQQSITQAGQTILAQVTPAVLQLFGGVHDIASATEEWKTGLGLVLTVVKSIQAAFSLVGDAIGGAAAAIGALVRGDGFKFAKSILDDQASAAASIGEKFGAKINDFWENLFAKKDPVTGRVVPPGSEGQQYRNNNPGNLRAYRPGQAVDSRGIRTFATLDEGMAALRDDIAAKIGRGLDTIAKIINVYAPAGDGNDVPAYIKAVSGDIGKGANDKLTAADRDALVAAIIRHEGAALTAARITPVGSSPGVSRASTAANASVAGAGNTTTVSVGQVTVNTQATDATGTAAGLASAIKRQVTIAQADVGQY